MNIKGLVAGLGNPGKQYAQTRHNMGFMAIHEFVRTISCPPEKKFSCELWKFSFPYTQDTWIFATPQTYMNLSGNSIQPLSAWYKIPTDNILIIHDELDLPFGTMQLKYGGGNAGHNGLKSISECLGTNSFYRLRIGIGRPNPPEITVTNWVLGKFASEECKKLTTLFQNISEVITLFIKNQIPVAAEKAKMSG